MQKKSRLNLNAVYANLPGGEGKENVGDNGVARRGRDLLTGSLLTQKKIEGATRANGRKIPTLEEVKNPS